MGIAKRDSSEFVYKQDIIAAAEVVMIHCHHLASDIIVLALSDTQIEPRCAHTLSRQLRDCAASLAAAVEKVNEQMGRDRSPAAGGP